MVEKKTIENNPLWEIYDDMDDMLHCPIEMNEANIPIEIYEGEFILKKETKEITINGKIQFDWFPSTGANFSGELINPKEYLLLSSFNHFDVIVEGFTLGTGLIIQTSIGTKYLIKGTFQLETITGDKSIAVEKVRFCIPNFKDYLGESVKKKTDKAISFSRNRLILDNNKFTIIIDKCHNHKDLKESLEAKGGYIITHTGELIPKNGTINFEESKKIMNALNAYLSFLNGKRVSTLFIHGVFQDKTIWFDYSNYHVDIHGFVPSWTTGRFTEGYNDLWKEFYLMWQKNKEVLDTAIHWYLECNKGSGFVEGSIIMAQTALELLYNWYIVENKKLIIGNDSENINAANKIRLLIAQLDVDFTVPKRFGALQKYLKSEKLTDAPQAIVQIRNAIVHSQEEKRKKLSQIEADAKYQALQISIWYIEITLLKMLNFKNEYFNRCADNTSNLYENVPWIK